MALPVASAVGASCLNSRLERTHDSGIRKGGSENGNEARKARQKVEQKPGNEAQFELENSPSLGRLSAGADELGWGDGR
jgi:hypothetical protein